MVRRFCIGAVALVWTLLVLTFAVAQDTEALSRAAGLFKNRQYNDVIRVLSEAVKNRPESEAGKEYLLLGESYYMTRQYELARPCFVHASRYLEGADKITADYRLACTYYRINDTTRATEKIKEFLGRYPDDARVGKLLAYQMLILTSQGKPAEKEIEDLHKRIQTNLAKYDYATGMEADEILCDFYRKTQQEDKAVALYTRIVNNFRQVAREYERDNRPLPATAKKSHDNAALQLGMLAMEKKNAGEAIKWFENIRYEPDLKQRARLFMAKLAYERQDFSSVASYLTGDGYLDTVPDGSVKWDMYLILALSAMRSGKANVDQVEGPLRKIPAEARGYHQAQLTLGNLYRDKSLLEYALKAFQNASGSADYEATALLRIGEILLEQGNREKDELKARELYRKSGDAFGRLFAKYPLSAEAKQAREKTGALADKGVLVAGDTGESNVKVWEKVSQDKPGSVEAAQALMSLIRHHFKRIADEKSGKLLRAPDYAAAAAECDRLLDRNIYNGAGWSESNWNALQTEVLYTRGMCELASLAPPAPKPDEPLIQYVKAPQASRAVAWLTSASKLVDKKQLDLIRSIEIALVEALFKSDRKEDRELAEKRYIELENNYGNDPRLQRLSLELADWYAEQKRFADAGRMLAGVASRGKDLPQENMMKILYNAGTMFSRAGMEAGKGDHEKGFWIRISPKSVVALGEDDLLKSYAPMRKTVDMRWPKGGRDLSAGEALLALSKAGKIPFTWATSKVDGSVAAYLEKKRVTLTDGPTTVADALAKILDFPHHRLEFAIGLTDGTPTLEPPKDKDDPDIDTWRLIEIYDARRLDLYYRPASAVFGAFRDVFGNKPALLYSILQRVEQVTGMRVVWAEGVERQEKLATEFRELPGIRSDYPASVMQALNQTLDSMGLQWKIVARDVMAEHFEAAKEQFNRLRQIDPKSKYGERALLSVALNYYSLRDYARMKVILREYLKVFDNPENENRQMAAYWIGWVFEKENNFREAGNYYGRAADERLVVYKLPPDRKPPSRDELKKMLSYESAVALLEPCSGEFVEKPLAAVLDFCTVNSHIEVRADASAQAIGVPVSRPAFKNVPVFDVLADIMEQLGLTYRVENVNPEFAEKAYFRMVAVNRKDNAMPQALEAAQTLLSRFPQTTRRREVYGMMIDIYKGLKDYRKVLETMEQLQAITDDPREKQRLANEIAWIYFDVADYPRAMKTFTICLENAQDPSDRIDLRDGYARAAYRARQYPQALEAYETLLKEDSRPLRQFINNLMVYIIKVETGKADERDIPRDAEKLIVGYEQLTEALRARLAPEDVAKATWVYYALAKRDLKKGYADQAIVKLNACANSTDDSLAAEALYELGAIHMIQKKYNDARELLEELLFRGKGTDTLVRGTYALGLCYIELGRNEKAREKFQQLMDRYPLSPFVEDIRKNPVFASAPAAP
jgi:TolA-binding protein